MGENAVWNYDTSGNKSKWGHSETPLSGAPTGNLQSSSVFAPLYIPPPFFFSNVTFHLKTYFKVIGFIVSSKRTIPWRQSLSALWPLPLEDTSHFRQLFQHKVLADGKKIRVAGEECQHRSHCVVIRDQDSLHMPTSLDKRPRPASTRCCNGATGDAQPFKEKAKKRHLKKLNKKHCDFIGILKELAEASLF